MRYKCGCEASGDNVANYCPIHQEPIQSNVLLYDVVIYHTTNRIVESVPGKSMHLDKGFSNAEKRLETVEMRINENYSAEIVPAGKYKIGDAFKD